MREEKQSVLLGSSSSDINSGHARGFLLAFPLFPLASTQTNMSFSTLFTLVPLALASLLPAASGFEVQFNYGVDKVRGVNLYVLFLSLRVVDVSLKSSH